MSVPVVRFVYGSQTRAGCLLTRPYTLVYDGTCTVCNRLVGVLRRRDARRRVEIIPSQNSGVRARFPWIPSESYAEAVQLIGPGGRTWQGAAAIEELLRILPRGWVLGWVFRVPLVGRLADRFYRWFARNRHNFGCGAHCAYRPARLKFGDPAD